ncbi:MAG TPA: hypothetical protein VFI56_28975 [Vicinamibacterales bacterium]|nr:hypothetical protein [Vicinamibacterales bacterium]
MATKKDQKKKRRPAPPKQRKVSVKPKRAASKPRPGKRAITGVTTGPVVTGGVTGTGVVVPPAILTPNGNFFDAGRPGHAVVRPTDLVALRLQLQNLVVTAGSPPRLRKTAAGAAYLVVHFPPQAITELAFFETKPKGTTNPANPPDGTHDDGGSQPPTPPPVRARISGESRLVFSVPDGFNVEYTLQGVLTAIENLSLVVTANATPPPPARGTILFADIFSSQLANLSAKQRASLSSFAVRSLRIAAVQGDAATFKLRQAAGGPGLRPTATVVAGPITGVVVGRTPPRPVAPTALQTAIELPWRLILSPYGAERWRHAKVPVTSPVGRTELWHSRLVAPNAKGVAIEPPRPDSQRTVRAIWALTGEGSNKPMQSAFPNGAADLPVPVDNPFRMPLSDFDRFQITHLSSNFSRVKATLLQPAYTPTPIGTNLLMLSALGGWLDSRGAWEVPPGLSVEEWVHRATMGRDHYVKVVYKGFAYPFGHRVALVKVTERKFHNGARDGNGQPTIEQRSGNTAYLRQRLFIVPREREMTFTETSLHSNDNSRRFHFQMPFSSVRLLTPVTPNLDQPNVGPSAIDLPPELTPASQRMFWPCVNGAPYRFQYSATDLDGRTVQFDLPIIFIDNTLLPDIATAEAMSAKARTAWQAANADRRQAAFKQQRIAFAQSVKAGDTSIQADTIAFDAEVEANNPTIRAYSNHLAHPPFYPKVQEAWVRIAALAQLTGSGKNNHIAWNAHYLKQGFDNNQGQVFVDVIKESGMAQLDFSTQGDRSGGFVQPNLKPSAISRLTGPVTGNVSNFINGTMTGTDAFPSSISDLPLPLLFGCIPLGDVIEAVTNLAGSPDKIPKFGSEASTQVESFINGLVRLFDFVSKLADQPGHLADAAMAAVKSTLQDLLAQAQSYAAPLVADAKARINQLTTALDGVVSQVQQLFDQTIDAAPALPGLPGAISAAQTAASNLRTTANASVGGVSLPSGFRQSLLQVANQLDSFLGDLGTIATLITQGKALFTALDAIVGHPDQLGNLLSDPGQLKTKIEALQAALGPIQTTLKNFHLIDGAPRQAILAAIDVVLQVLDAADDLLKLLEMLTGDELTIRFDWNPKISNWALPGADPNKDALFRANDKRGFLVAVEAKVKKNGQSAPKISVVCSLKSFDLVLIAPASFIELNFEKIEFRVDSSAKMDVDVLLTDIKFVGPLSFVETLRDLIPLNGFSDPPFLDITPQGIDAGFSLSLPNVAIGVFSLTNLSLGAGFTVPFIGQPLSVRFNFCTREQPFNLTVTLFGGGGFFGITLDPHGIQILEASFEFGASISIDLGVASGGVHVMAGLYFRMENSECSLTGYFRLGGEVSVLGIISASLELYLELKYEFESGKCVGTASLTIEVSVFMFSASVTVTCQKKFAGSNGDPSFRDLMGINPALSLADELASIGTGTTYAWRDYCEAFA